MTANQESESLETRKQIITDFLKDHSNSVHKRILEAYDGNDPVSSMEDALATILEEIATDED